MIIMFILRDVHKVSIAAEYVYHLVYPERTVD